MYVYTYPAGSLWVRPATVPSCLREYYCITVLLYVLLYCCMTVLLSYYITILLYYYFTILLYNYTTTPLYYYIAILLYCYIAILLYRGPCTTNSEALLFDYLTILLHYYRLHYYITYYITILLYYLIATLLYYYITARARRIRGRRKHGKHERCLPVAVTGIQHPCGGSRGAAFKRHITILFIHVKYMYCDATEQAHQRRCKPKSPPSTAKACIHLYVHLYTYIPALLYIVYPYT